jgi:hypothetical protein
MKIKDFIYIGIILTLCGYCAYLRNYNNKIKPTIIYELDTIYIKKDSILNIIKENEIKSNNLEDNYKKDYIRIVNQSSTADIEFFSNYLDSTFVE